MNDTAQAQPSVVLRPTHQQLRVLLTIAAIVIVGLTIAVAMLATSSGTGTVASSATRVRSTTANAHAAPTQPRAVASQEAGAKLDHSGRNIAGVQASSGATGSPQVGPNPDQRDLMSNGGTFAPAGPNPDQATP